MNPKQTTAKSVAVAPADNSRADIERAAGAHKGMAQSSGPSDQALVVEAGVTMPPVHPIATDTLPYTLVLPCLPESVGRARALVSCALGAWGMSALADEGRLIVSELVTNVVDHTTTTQTTIAVERKSPHSVRIHVPDSSRVPPCLTDVDSRTESGRGLSLVEGLSCCWGYEESAWGKVTWAELSLAANR